MNDLERLKESTRGSLARLRRAERERGSFIAHTMYLGTLGLLTAIPVVGGAYAGMWLDEALGTYGFTLLCIAAGVVVAAVNVYLMLRE
jgi:ATP synthase protein I